MLQKVRTLPQQRLDLPDFRNLSEFVCADLKAIHKNLWSQENFVFSGFEASGTGTSDLSIVIEGSSAIFGANDGVVYIGANGLAPLETSALTPSTTNYVEIIIEQDTGGADSRAFWDQTAAGGAGGEFSQIIDTYSFIKASFAINTSNFTSDADKLAICEVDVNAAGIITEIRDARNFFFRLGRAGQTDFSFSWASRVEPPDTQFTGADKDIQTLKQLLDALMSRIKEIDGTTYWYETSGVSLTGVFRNAALSAVTAIGNNVVWSWDGSDLSLTDDSLTPADADVLAKISIFDSTADINLTRMDGQGGSATIPLADGEILWIELPAPLATVNIDDVGLTSTNYRVSAKGSVPLDEKTFWLAYREGSNLYIRNQGELEPGEQAEISDNINENILQAIGIATETSLPNYSSVEIITQNDSLVDAVSDLDAALNANTQAANQDRSSKLIEGGTWSYDNSTTTLTLSQDAYVQLPEVTNESNTVQAQSIVLPNANSVAYVEVNRTTSGPTNLVVNVADVDAVVPTQDTVIIARRVTDGVLVGQHSFLLKDGEFLELDGALAEINRLLNQLKLQEHESNTDQARILSSEIEQLEGSTLNQVIGNFMLKFDGAVVDFTTGDVFEADGSTPLGVNFTPTAIPNGEYHWYGLSLNPDAVNPINQQLATVSVEPGTNTDADPALAEIPILPGTIKIGWIQVFNNAGTIEINDVRRLGPGTGAGSGGTGFVKVDYYDPISSTLPTGVTVTLDGQAGVDGDLVLFGNLSSNNNRVYELSGVGSSIAWTPVRSFDGQFDPQDGDAVIVLKGDAFQEQTPIFNGIKFLVNDVIRLFDDVSGDFWELGSIKTSTLVNNTTNTIFSVNATGSENIIVNYSLARGTNKETGQLMITTNGTDAEISRHTAFIGALGVNFTVQINAGDLELNYSADNQGVDAIMKFYLHRWSNSAGGPTGVPSYSGSTTSTTPAAGVLGDVQYHGASGNLEADSRFKWDSSKSALSLDGLEITSLQGPVTINDNVGSPTLLLNYPVSSYNFTIVEYSIERGTNYRVGRILIPNSSTNASFSDDSVEVGSTGVSFTVSVNGGNVELNYLSTSTGQSGEFKYSIRQWA